MPQQASLGVGILQGIPQPKPFGTLANVNRLSAMADEEQAQQQERAAQQVLSQISAQYADNPDGAVEELRRRGFAKQAQALESHILDTKKKTFDIRKVELENERLTGQIAGEAADREIKAMAARSPEEILKLYAGVDTPEEAEIGKGLMRYKFGAKAEPVIALLGEFSPEKSAFAARTVMGPAKMADIENAGLAREQAWDLAKADDTRADAQQAQTTTYQNRMATVAERNAGTNATRAAQTGTGGGGAASGSDKAMVAAILKNPQIYETLTPTVKTRLAVPLSDAGFNFAQKVVSDGKPSTGMEKRALNFFNRAKQSDEELANVEETIAKSGTAAQFWRETMPNFLQTTAGQQYTAAQRAFTEARLRKDSGAAIPETEFANDRKTYFVQAGDDKATVTQKQRARAALLASLSFESGRALGEFFGEDAPGMIEGYKTRGKQPSSGAGAKLTKEIPGFPGSLAESSDGGKTWKRIK